MILPFSWDILGSSWPLQHHKLIGPDKDQVLSQDITLKSGGPRRRQKRLHTEWIFTIKIYFTNATVEKDLILRTVSTSITPLSLAIDYSVAFVAFNREAEGRAIWLILIMFSIRVKNTARTR